MTDNRTLYQRARDKVAFNLRMSYSAVVARRRLTTVGRRPSITGKVQIRCDGTAIVGDLFTVSGEAGMVKIYVAPGALLTIGHETVVSANVNIEATHEVRIGSNVMLASNCSILDDAHHDVEPGAVRYKGPTIIGSNVWLGRNVMVLPGVEIGDGSVIGANSVVAKDIPPNVLAGGMPAQVLRKLDIPDGWLRSTTGQPLGPLPVVPHRG